MSIDAQGRPADTGRPVIAGNLEVNVAAVPAAQVQRLRGGSVGGPDAGLALA